MKIDTTKAVTPSGFYPVNFEVFSQTLDESKVGYSIDMGCVTIHHGTRDGASIWFMDNPMGSLYGIWLEENERRPN